MIQDDDKANDDRNKSDYFDTELMSSMDIFDDPLNTYDTSYGATIEGL